MSSSDLSNRDPNSSNYNKNASFPEAPIFTPIPETPFPGRIPETPRPPVEERRFLGQTFTFWRDRLIEAGLIISILLYYVIGNNHLGTSRLFTLNPLYSLPFLLLFVVFCWYRLAFAVALLPLSLPYYLLQKTVYSHYAFSMAEIILAVCTGVALFQLVLRQNNWQYLMSWKELQGRIGPFLIPLVVFFLAASLSVLFAIEQHIALRAYREEIVDPILYLLLAFICLRTRADLTRWLVALFATGFIVSLLGIAQFILFRHQLKLDASGIQRVYAVYSGANDIGVLFDYTLPLGLAFIMAKTHDSLGIFPAWSLRLLAILACIPMLLVLYLSQSGGGWTAMAVAVLFIVALSIRNRRILLVGGITLVVLAGGVVLLFHTQLTHLLFEHHANAQGVSTVTRRFYLWQSAIRMIKDYPWLGVGMDNWLCHYSKNTVCTVPTYHYWLTIDPVTGKPTGMGEEPLLSQPHNDILNMWVNTGIFGLIAFLMLIGLFFWLFTRILTQLRSTSIVKNEQLRWMTVGVGAALLAAFVQSMVDSAFLGQDFSFFFWILIGSMLLLRFFSETPWWGRLRQP